MTAMATEILIVDGGGGDNKLQYDGCDIPTSLTQQAMALQTMTFFAAGVRYRLPILPEDFKAWMSFAAPDDPQTPGDTNESLQSLAALYKVQSTWLWLVETMAILLMSSLD